MTKLQEQRTQQAFLENEAAERETERKLAKAKANKVEEEETEEERCLRIVKSVLDEQTVLEMATDFLEMTRGADVPDWASLSFKSCSFDWEKGRWLPRQLMLKVLPKECTT